MKKHKDIFIIASISIILAIIGFILDINERIPDITTNIVETFMLAALIFAIIFAFYFPIKIIFKPRRRVQKAMRNDKH